MPALMPNLGELRATGLSFDNHWSGGNSSRAGIFSFFYGLPSSYMETFYGVHRVYVDQANEYSMWSFRRNNESGGPAYYGHLELHLPGPEKEGRSALPK